MRSARLLQNEGADCIRAQTQGGQSWIRYHEDNTRSAESYAMSQILGSFIDQPLYFAILLFLILLLSSELGFRLGRYRRVHAEARQVSPDAGALTGIVYALLGLLIAFTFANATQRFDERRDLILKEANAIGTSYLRIDLLPQEAQPDLRALYRSYTRSRIDAYQSIKTDIQEAKRLHQQGLDEQQLIWQKTLPAAVATQNTSTQTLVINALNDMIDVANERLAATRKHPPAIIFIMLFVLSAVASALAGYNLAAKPRLPRVQIIVFALVLAGTMFVVNDLGHARIGLFTIEDADILLIEVLQSMGR